MIHESNSILRESLVVASNELPVNSEWRHFRTLERYLITGHVILEASDEVGIVYVCRDGDFVPMVRPAREWCEDVITAGVIVPRFTSAKTLGGLQERG